MPGSMVSARMPASRREAGNRVLEALGSNASQAINGLYEYLIEHGSLPWQDEAEGSRHIDGAQLRKALEWVGGLQVDLSPEFSGMSIRDSRRRRLGLGE